MRKGLLRSFVWLVLLVGMLGFYGYFRAVRAEEERNRPLIEAVRRGEPKTVRELLAQGLDPNCRDLYDNRFVDRSLLDRLRHRPLPPAALAVALGDDQASRAPSDGSEHEPIEIVEALLSHGARARTLCPNGDPVINRAAFYGYSRCVGALLAHGAAVNDKHENGTTVLMMAIAGGNVETVKVLVKHDVEVNAAYVDLAKNYNDPRMVGYLQKVVAQKRRR
jgi:ankyrin repeat protein